jgi:ATP-dependent Clp protease ATP-binding subunit ClpC
MFERYTARRVIFFARYEASEFGSSYIETEHLLLGLAREQRWVLQLIPDLEVDSLRARIETLVPVGKKFPTSEDLPLSNECKRMTASAAQHTPMAAIGSARNATTNS